VAKIEYYKLDIQSTMFTLCGTRLQCIKDETVYVGEIKEIPRYFTPPGYLEYITDNLAHLELRDYRAVYEMIDIPMEERGSVISVIHTLGEQNDQLKQKIAEVQEDYARLDAENEKLITQNAKLQANCNLADANNAELRDEGGRVIVENAELRVNYDLSDRENTQLRAENASLNKQVARLNVDYANISDQLSDIKADFVAQDRMIQKYSDQQCQIDKQNRILAVYYDERRTYEKQIMEAEEISKRAVAKSLALESRITQLASLVPVLQFASHYPTWSTWAEFAQLPDYQYISDVLDDFCPMKHNFTNRGDTFNLVDTDNHGPQHHMIPPFGASSVMKNLIATWTGDHAAYYARAGLFTSSVVNPPGELHDFISLYIIGVLAGWLNTYSEAIRPYEYLIFIDVGQSITFRLVTMQKHAECPAVFFFDKHRVIINGAIRRDL
jgi:hypothetical protein